MEPDSGSSIKVAYIIKNKYLVLGQNLKLDGRHFLNRTEVTTQNGSKLTRALGIYLSSPIRIKRRPEDSTYITGVLKVEHVGNKTCSMFETCLDAVTHVLQDGLEQVSICAGT
jgi:hypothetical protein